MFLLHRRATRQQWRQVGRIIDAVAGGGRPTSFILHGEAALRQIGLGLETLAVQRERLERQISQEGFNLQVILSSMAEGVRVVDTGHCIRLVNTSFLAFFELQTAPLGRSILHSLRNAAIEDGIRAVLDEGAAQSREIALTSSGRHLAMSASPVRDSAGTILGVAAIFHDITLLKQLEEVRREFVANVSHELRTPLSIFQGYVELLQENPGMPREELERNLQVLRKHSTRLNLLVEDLLTLARLESRSRLDEMERAPLRIDALLRGVGEDWKLKFAAKQVAFRLETAPDLPAISGDAFRLEQVFYNLLENALKYTPVGGTVSIEALPRAQEGGIEIRVGDSGSGIPPADLAHIFERFYRADKARSRSLGGTGLGLSIVKHIVQLHGGNVCAESVYGGGTTVIIQLPASNL